MKNKIIILLFVAFLTFLCVSSSYANPIKEKFAKAMVAYHAKQFDQAIELFNETLKLHPKFAPSLYYIALIHQEKEVDTALQIELYKKVIEADPKYYQAHDQLGKLYYTQGDFDLAEQHALKALEIKPDLLTSKLSLAWIYMLGKGDPYSAIPYFKSALEEQDIPYALFGLGMAYAQTDKMPLVLEMVTKLRKANRDLLAIQLEQMIRENRYIPPINLGDRKAQAQKQQREESLLVSDPKHISYSDAEENMQVRLRGDPKLSDPAVSSSNSTHLSGEERIRLLQQKNLQKGSGY